ncbi:WS/DGAT/MGAT family O-acyltransferase [Algiphilus sp.]|uniref:WS/DGAT/MGAT family O-acyltransferase n=1 Tax=Algiphilus sp. TaxID=1872431 RepID=UPI003C5E0FA8
MKRLGVLDTAFLRMESARTPMHVGGLMTFKLPDDAPNDYLHRLTERLRAHPFMPFPFDHKLHWPASRAMPPAWVPAETDLDYHIRHSALPYPGGERELGVLVARLHSHAMDFDRPLWECHLIEGLENNRFAFYFKAHHCAIDGMGGMQLVKTWLSPDPDDRHSPGERLAAANAERAARRRPEPPIQAPRGLHEMLERVMTGSKVRAGTARDIASTFYRLSQGGENSVIRAALRTPRTPFNVPVTAQRRLGTQLLERNRLSEIAHATDTTINDIALSLCGGATRRYLQELDALPDRPLTASVPIGLPRTDGKPGNAVSGFVCPIGTHIPDPLLRLQRIHSITQRTKEQMLCVSSAALERFGMFGIAPLMLGQLTGTLPKWPPLFNVVLSNVVASKERLYMMGAELEAIYPMSILFDGYGLNLTVVGYADSVAVGYTGCRNAVPSLQRLAVYTGEALDELEGALKPGRKRRAPRKKPQS